MPWNLGSPATSSSLDSLPVRENFEFLRDSLKTHVSGSNAHNADAITIDVIGSPSIDNVEEFHSNILSAGTLCIDLITDGGDGTITVSSGSGFIRAIDLDSAPLLSFEWASSSSIAINDDVLTYVYLDYNGGSPIIKTTTDRNDISDNCEVCIGHAYKESGSLTIHTRTGGLNTCDITRRIDRRIKDLRNFERSSGMVTSESGVRNITITAGEGWRGLDRFTTLAQNTSGSGDTFTYWYRDGGGGWTKVIDQTQIDNTQYDDGSGTLQTLNTNKYGVHWVFLCNDGHIDIVYGQGDYKLAEAQIAEVPSGLPDKINKFDLIIAKIIIKKNDATFTEVATAFEIFFPRSEVINHNDLGNLDGGKVDEYYHLENVEHSALVDGGSADGYHIHPASGSGEADTLDSVCERGAETDVAITVSASGSVFNSLHISDDLQAYEGRFTDGIRLGYPPSMNRSHLTWYGNPSYGQAGKLWFQKIDTSNSPTIDLIFFGIVNPDGTQGSLFHVKRNAEYEPPSIGWNISPPPSGSAFVVGAGSGSLVGWQNTFAIRKAENQNSNLFKIYDSAGNDQILIDSDYELWRRTDGMTFRGNSTDNRVLAMCKEDKTRYYGFEFNGNNLQLRYFTGGVTFFEFETDGEINPIGAFSQNLALNKNLILNADYSDDDAVVYFYKPTSGYETLIWNKTTTQFEFSDDLWVDGTIEAIGSGSVLNNLKIDNNLHVYGDLIVEGVFAAVHNNLSGLQGGKANEYYHLENAEHGALVDGGSADGYHIHPASGSGGAVGTKYIILPIDGATLPDDSAGNKSAAVERKKSSAGAPSPHFMQVLFDDTTEEFLYWSFRFPGDYGSGLTAKIQYKMENALASSGSVYFDVALMAVSPGDAQDVDADSMDTVNSGNATVPGTVGYLGEISITLTNIDSLAAGDFIVLYLKRDADNVSDTATGDAEVIGFSIEYIPS